MLDCYGQPNVWLQLKHHQLVFRVAVANEQHMLPLHSTPIMMNEG
jgi:hypothetical protein